MRLIQVRLSHDRAGLGPRKRVPGRLGWECGARLELYLATIVG